MAAPKPNNLVCFSIADLCEKGLSADAYTVLSLLYRKQYADLVFFVKQFIGQELYTILLERLQEEGWCHVNGDIYRNVQVRQKFLDIYIGSKDMKKLGKHEPISWITEYRELFRGKKPGSMGDGKAVERLMRKFIIDNPEFTKDQIMDATKRYISSCAPSYQYLMYADHFIQKGQGSSAQSRLRAWLEDTSLGIGSYNVFDTARIGGKDNYGSI